MRNAWAMGYGNAEAGKWAAGAAIGLVGLWALGLSAALAMQVQMAQKHPRPTGQELAKAEKVVQEVFGRDMQKAQTPQQKAALAREILKAAREEQDPAVRFRKSWPGNSKPSSDTSKSQSTVGAASKKIDL